MERKKIKSVAVSPAIVQLDEEATKQLDDSFTNLTNHKSS
jgi:hypothetical protein